MPFYTAYGLGIDSCISLPELVPGAKQIDLVIKRGQILEKPAEINDTQFYYWRSDRQIGLYWHELGTFLIQEGREIIIDANSEIEEQYLHPALFGACMAVLLHQRGYLILHASAIAIEGKAIAFIGDKGWGKSTMAMALLSRGHQFISDDVLAINLNSENPLVFPSFPQLKLCLDTVKAIGQDPESLPRVMPKVNKRQYKISHNFSIKPVPLRSIYLLTKGKSLSIEKIAASNLILPLLAHSYGARFGKKLLYLGEAEHFLQCTNLANKIGIYRLQRPSNISLLDDIVNLVEQHLSVTGSIMSNST